MRSSKALVFFMLLIFTITPTFTLAQFEVVENNNIYLTGTVEMELNVTLVNLGDTPKYIMVNPRYQFEVIRENRTEFLYHNSTGATIIGNPTKTLLNYRPGFWIYPHEVLKVRFFINEIDKIPIPLYDYYQPYCTGYAYIEGDKLRINVPVGFYTVPICDVLYPQLLNRPIYLYPEALFNVKDFSVVMHGYKGIVKFKIVHNSTLGLPIRDVFAVAPPILFPNARIYGYFPSPTMSYSEYLDYVKGFWKLNIPKILLPTKNLTDEIVLYGLTDDLLTSKFEIPRVKNVKQINVEYPIWIIWLGDNSTFEITYKFEWGTNKG
ncbi:hypothetical protein [Pyrococcus kukulkanii]|uniref:Intracellular proteinase inhibitor BsuPI domain-containing protein n=1 Tax=Pyrococcus kukulkanii TaxID=1609559 RepID=A0ABV4T3A4_9EURY